MNDKIYITGMVFSRTAQRVNVTALERETGINNNRVTGFLSGETALPLHEYSIVKDCIERNLETITGLYRRIRSGHVIEKSMLKKFNMLSDVRKTNYNAYMRIEKNSRLLLPLNESDQKILTYHAGQSMQFYMQLLQEFPKL